MGKIKRVPSHPDELKSYVENHTPNFIILFDHWCSCGCMPQRDAYRIGYLATCRLKDFYTMPLDLARIRAICFDVDGTLRDTDDQFVQLLESWLRPVRFLFKHRDPHPFARWLVMKSETPGNLLFGLPDRLGLDAPLARLGDLVYQLGMSRTETRFLVVQGVQEMLAALQVHYPLSVVSARGERNTLAFLRQHDLETYFARIATGQTCRYTKPAPDPILWAAQGMGVAPQEILMVGDTVIDIRAGKAAGAQTVGVLCGFGQEAELRREGADLVLPNTSDLLPILLNGGLT
jgi:phosphoglycolate phosphatase-like HAD superfamily hydrolase